MFELTIKDEVYQFKFGMAFVRDIDKKMQRKENGVTKDVGLQFAVASLIDKDPLGLVDILDIANKTEKPRVTRKLLDEYLEDETTDIDALFEEVLDFFEQGNSTKATTTAVLKLIEEQKVANQAE